MTQASDVPREAKTVIQESDQADSNVFQIRMCKCGRAPHRKALTPNSEKPRNCHFCHSEANKKYRKSIRAQLKQLRAILWAAKSGA